MRKLLVLLAPLLLMASLTTAFSTDTSLAYSHATSARHTLTSAGCPTSNTKKFAKTRFAANVGLIAGSFHRYIYKAYKAGKFNKGAHGRIRAYLKAGTTALFVKHEVGNAIDNAKANPTLCKLLIAPLSALQQKLSALKSKILHGDTRSIEDMNTEVKSITTGATDNGVSVKEKSN